MFAIMSGNESSSFENLDIAMQEFRLTLPAYNAFESQGLFPKRSKLRNFLSEKEVQGRGNDEIARFFARKSVGEPFALGFIDFLKANPNYIPQGLLDGDVESLSVKSIFEESAPYERSLRYVQPGIGTDPSFAKEAKRVWSELASAALSIIFGPDELRDPEKAFLDATTGFQAFERMTYIDHGFASSKKGERLSLDEAYTRSRTFLNEPEGHLASYVEGLFSINPNFIRYAVSSENDKVGISVIFPITDEAYELSVAGERPMYSYEDHEIVRRGNNLVLFALTENHEYEGRLSFLNCRRHLMSSMFEHIAMLLDSDKPRTVRCISYEIHSANTRRLKNVGFLPCGKANGPGGFEHQVVYFDPNKNEGYTRKGMTLLSDFVWLVRKRLDSKE
jgi:hypothetical protein